MRVSGTEACSLAGVRARTSSPLVLLPMSLSHAKNSRQDDEGWGSWVPSQGYRVPLLFHSESHGSTEWVGRDKESSARGTRVGGDGMVAAAAGAMVLADVSALGRPIPGDRRMPVSPH